MRLIPVRAAATWFCRLFVTINLGPILLFSAATWPAAWTALMFVLAVDLVRNLILPDFRLPAPELARRMLTDPAELPPQERLSGHRLVPWPLMWLLGLYVGAVLLLDSAWGVGTPATLPPPPTAAGGWIELLLRSARNTSAALEEQGLPERAAIVRQVFGACAAAMVVGVMLSGWRAYRSNLHLVLGRLAREGRSRSPFRFVWETTLFLLVGRIVVWCLFDERGWFLGILDHPLAQSNVSLLGPMLIALSDIMVTPYVYMLAMIARVESLEADG